MRKTLLILPVLAIAACQPAVPNSGPGVGFGDYRDYLSQREAALQGQRPAPAAPQMQAANAGAVRLDSLGATLPPRSGEAQNAPMNAMGAAVAPAPVQSGPSAVAQANAAPLPRDSSGAVISDENNFDAVASRETIASDKARMEANRAAYQQIQPGALPPRSGDTGPNLAAYALQASNRLGEPVWKRGGLSLSNHTRACAKFTSLDQAQIAFLNRGGPQKDPGNLDPDGDGFACFWDPTPFQAARQ